MKLLAPDDEIADLAAKSATAFVEAANDLIRARVLQDGAAYRRAIESAAALFGRVLAMGDLLGRRRMQLLAERAEAHVKVRAALVAEVLAQLRADTPIVERVEFKEATQDVLSRHPELAPGWKAVADVYAERHGFACARAMDVAVTERVRDVIADTVAGRGPPNPRKVIQELGDWTAAYADTVYETNIRTAYTAGMWSRMEDAAVARVLPGARFVSAQLPTSRPNHVAAHGLTAPTNSLLWEHFSPPLGYRCQCALREVSIFEARREGLLDAQGHLRTIYPSNFANAHPDPGFGRTRPDRAAAAGSFA